MPITDSETSSPVADVPNSDRRRRVLAAWIPWIKRLVLIIVAVALAGAAIQAVGRWQIEIAALQADLDSLVDAASKQSDPSKRQAMLADAETKSRQIPSLANLNGSGLAVAAMLYGLGLLPPGWILFRVLSAMRVPASLARSTSAQLLGHAGKYIPGKAMVVVLRVGAILPQGDDATGPDSINTAAKIAGETGDGQPAHRSDRPVAKATASVFYETLMMMGVGGILSGVLLLSVPLPAWIRVMAFVMAIGSAIPVCPPVMRWMLSQLQKNKTTTSPYNSVSWRLLLESSIVSGLSWILIGGSFTVLIVSIPSLEPVSLNASLFIVATASIAIGMVLGFASLLPGGAGVREYATLLVLTPSIGPTHALLAVIAARLMFILVEAAMAGLAWWVLRTDSTSGVA